MLHAQSPFSRPFESTMSSNGGYEMVDSDSKGKIVMATRDFMPGETVLEEKEPLMYLDEELLKQNKLYDSTDNHIFLASFITFMKRLEPEKKAKLLTLFGPSNGATAEGIREYASSVVNYSPDNQTAPRKLNALEIKTFVKVSNVMRLNMFECEEGKALYSEITRFSHSCCGNCSYSFDGKTIYCRTNQHVRSGEELTFSYMPHRDLEPTHVRRHKYLEAKEFTCHCARCDDPGDDTRQFDCFYLACKGVMMACQPCNKEEVRVTGLPYTGVEYVEPHLLPCTECHRPAPDAYQVKMFALEAQLPALAVRFAKTQEELVSKRGHGKNDPLLQEILSRNLPRRHQMVVPILNVLMKIYRYPFFCAVQGVTKFSVEKSRVGVQRAAREYIAAQEAVIPWVQSSMCNVLYQVCHDCIVEWQHPMLRNFPSIFPPLESKGLLQRTIRMYLILSPRHVRKGDLDAALLSILQGLPPQLYTEECAFCEESPLLVALTLSRCSRCRAVCYCSAGCQKAHWSLHKKTCKAPTVVVK